ncbi:MAG TPA: HD domain-containing protein [Ignavibacteriales bacterium]|nr:HD domain-containing protein [Ignavibacteriales bacterium]
MKYLIKEPDFTGGFIYKSIENLHIVTRDGEGNLIKSIPVNLIRKGLSTDKGTITGFDNDKVYLLSGNLPVSADRYLFNSYLMKKALEEEEKKMSKGLLGIFKKPKVEAPTSGPAWNRKGGEKPGHKYISRKPNKTGDGYIYLYELPNGNREWRDREGNTVNEKEHESYSDFKEGEYIEHEGRQGKIIEASDNIYAIDFGDKKVLLHKEQHMQKLQRDLNLKEGDEIEVHGVKGRVKEVGNTIALVESPEGNFFYKLSSPIKRVPKLDGIKTEREREIKIMEGEPDGDTEKLKTDYQNMGAWHLWKEENEAGGYNRKNDLRYEKRIESPFGELRVSKTFDPISRKEAINVNGTDNPTFFYGGKTYQISNLSDGGMQLRNEFGETGYKSFDEMDKELEPKINLIERQADEGEKRSLRFTWDRATGKIKAERVSRDKEDNPDRQLESIKEAVRQKAEDDKSRWRKVKETGPVQSDEEKARIEEENAQNREKIKEALGSPEYADFAHIMTEMGYSVTANPLIATKEVQFNNQKYKLKAEFSYKDKTHTSGVFDGPYKQVQLGADKFDIYDISGGVITYVDSAGSLQKVTKDELESINGKGLFTPTGSFTGKIGKPTKIIMPDNTQRNANFAIMSLDDIKASHNEKTFLPTESYPQEEGRSVNDRDYEHDENAQTFVRRIAQNWDSRTINSSKEAGQNIIVTKDGFVVSGNNRTMSAKLAAEENPEKWAQYQQDLKAEIEDYGFSPADLEGMKNPVLVKIDHDIPELSKAELGKYNQDTTKGKDFVQKGMEYSDILKKSPQVMNSLIGIVNGVENFTDIYRSARNQADVMKLLTDSGIVLPQKLPDYFNQKAGTLTEQGKELFETVLISSVLDQEALSVSQTDGVKSLTGNLKESISSLSKNMALQNGYSLKDRVNNAVNLQSRYARTAELKGTDFNTFLRQMDMFDNPPSKEDVAINILSKKGPRILNAAIKSYNDTAEIEVQGGGMFGEAATPEEVFMSKIINAKNPFSAGDLFSPEEKEVIGQFSTGNKANKSLGISIKNTIFKAFRKLFRTPPEAMPIIQETDKNLPNNPEFPDNSELEKEEDITKSKNSVILFGKRLFYKGIDKTNNQLLQSKKNPMVRRWQRIDKEAEGYAKDKHQGQLYGNGEPYFEAHLIPVMHLADGLAREVNPVLAEKVRTAALLHDTIEDTGATKEEIAGKFGEDIAESVFRVSKDKAMSKDEFFKRLSEDEVAKIVKAADRIHNIKELARLTDKDKQKKLYEKYSGQMEYFERYKIFPEMIKEELNKINLGKS